MEVKEKLGESLTNQDVEESGNTDAADLNIDSGVVATDEASSSAPTKRKADTPSSERKKKKKKKNSSQSSNITGEILIDTSISFADKLSALLLNIFGEVTKDIPPEKLGYRVIAGMAMTRESDMKDIEIITFGTGTKCVNAEHMSMCGDNINDCHAEIIARRGLKLYFYRNLEMLLEGECEQAIFTKKESGGFRLKPHVKFHLFISTAPCGDARIFLPREENTGSVDCHPNRNSQGVLRTKIKSGEGTIPVKGARCLEAWDCSLPIQERFLKMSCSDKVASWNVLGLQGALLSHFIEPIYLESIILGGLYNRRHLTRALFGRIECYVKDLPALYRVNKPNMSATTRQEKRHVLPKRTELSINWTAGISQPEIINPYTGKTENGQVSRIAKKSLFLHFTKIHEQLSPIEIFPTTKPLLYGAFKNSAESYKKAQEILEKAFLSAGLGRWVKKPAEQQEFQPEKNE